MKYNDELLVKVSKLFFASFDGDISEKQFSELEKQLLNNEEAPGF